MECDQRLLFTWLNLVGEVVQVHTADGCIVEGVLAAPARGQEGVGVILCSARHKPSITRQIFSPADYIDTLLVSADDVVLVEAKAVRFVTEVAAAGQVHQLAEDRRQRPLQAFNMGACDDIGDLEDELQWQEGGWDQFETNQRKFGVKSTYDEKLYTTVLDHSKITETQRREADRMTREINSRDSKGIQHQLERNCRNAMLIDEGEAFSDVRRQPGNETPEPQQIVPSRDKAQKSPPTPKCATVNDLMHALVAALGPTPAAFCNAQWPSGDTTGANDVDDYTKQQYEALLPPVAEAADEPQPHHSNGVLQEEVHGGMVPVRGGRDGERGGRGTRRGRGRGMGGGHYDQPEHYGGMHHHGQGHGMGPRGPRLHPGMLATAGYGGYGNVPLDRSGGPSHLSGSMGPGGNMQGQGSMPSRPPAHGMPPTQGALGWQHPHGGPPGHPPANQPPPQPPMHVSPGAAQEGSPHMGTPGGSSLHGGQHAQGSGMSGAPGMMPMHGPPGVAPQVQYSPHMPPPQGTMSRNIRPVSGGMLSPQQQPYPPVATPQPPGQSPTPVPNQPPVQPHPGQPPMPPMGHMPQGMPPHVHAPHMQPSYAQPGMEGPSTPQAPPMDPSVGSQGGGGRSMGRGDGRMSSEGRASEDGGRGRGRMGRGRGAGSGGRPYDTAGSDTGSAAYPGKQDAVHSSPPQPSPHGNPSPHQHGMGYGGSMMPNAPGGRQLGLSGSQQMGAESPVPPNVPMPGGMPGGPPPGVGHQRGMPGGMPTGHQPPAVHGPPHGGPQGPHQGPPHGMPHGPPQGGLPMGMMPHQMPPHGGPPGPPHTQPHPGMGRGGGPPMAPGAGGPSMGGHGMNPGMNGPGMSGPPMAPAMGGPGMGGLGMGGPGMGGSGMGGPGMGGPGMGGAGMGGPGMGGAGMGGPGMAGGGMGGPMAPQPPMGGPVNQPGMPPMGPPGMGLPGGMPMHDHSMPQHMQGRPGGPGPHGQGVGGAPTGAVPAPSHQGPPLQSSAHPGNRMRRGGRS